MYYVQVHLVFHVSGSITVMWHVCMRLIKRSTLWGISLLQSGGGLVPKLIGKVWFPYIPFICTAGETGANLGQKRFNSSPLNNKALFRRDVYLCLYCGKQFDSGYLSRDHINPLSREEKDVWANCANVFKRCNHRKGNQTLKEGNMELIAILFAPSHAECIYLCVVIFC